ncbi:hypothetical protein MKW92_044027, partial [Papaver armeniacum]
MMLQEKKNLSKYASIVFPITNNSKEETYKHVHEMELEKHDLVVSGNVTRKKFSYCLDGRNGIGIVVVGDVVQPNQSSIEVGKDVFNFSSVVFPVRVSDEVFPGTAMSYFPEGIFKKLYKM